ncbi:YceI family protein [Lentzea californiensis]|uniref:YceI family protein n=1 Tax=Lentzea californiensis TaxID=438851 RepID=UPI002166727D|nr:YceI family protein [Lentzea californiensis]MCR3750014.1 Polyisoprenoid-binding protein YceI [Lentzea californiensis]
MTATRALAAGVWQADLSRSTASFQVGNLGRKAHGTVPVTAGTVEIGTDGTLLAVHGTLDLGAIDTGKAKRDKDLRKPGLLDLDRHPVMTFIATSARTEGTGWHVTGTLAARGTETELAGTVELSSLDGREAVLTATARLDRRTLGIRAPSFMIGKWVDVTVTAVIAQSA